MALLQPEAMIVTEPFYVSSFMLNPVVLQKSERNAGGVKSHVPVQLR